MLSETDRDSLSDIFFSIDLAMPGGVDYDHLLATRIHNYPARHIV
jgi:hypothetical protein